MINILNLHLSGVNDNGWLNLAITSDKHTVRKLKKLEPFIRYRYTEYNNIIKHYQKEPSNSRFENHSTLLKNYYLNAPTNLNPLILARRHNKELEQCPFCGRPCNPAILDHFVPKTKWPEFAIYPNNLVNQCETCSTKKGERFYCSISNSSKYIHPLYSNLLSKLEYEYDIQINNPTNMRLANISLTLKIPRNFRKKQRDRVKLHLKSLDTINFATDYAQEIYLKRLREAEKRKVNICNMLNDFVLLNTNTPENNWKVCLYKSMLNNPIIVTHFNNLAP
ncbi:hypothetical protein PVK62_16115 [Aliivibrio sp. S3MY1]|uniref:hypothetical protein n=1 Tax=unclassified Aliivibrio TaxID=2645654 RepID=UPI0023786560|nr:MULTISPECIES: hypothetical protein [unclassified Aliivibrio]MDD9197354.1 hypothetical protein [Aliivibrio sp. S3MY1]MDD9200572.1 hypothetical protein [Aliivibrio sp. S2MY1]